MSEKKEEKQIDRLKALTSNQNLKKAFNEMEEQDQLQLVRANADFIYAMDNPSDKVLEEAVKFKIDLLWHIDPKRLTDNLLIVAIQSDIEKYGTDDRHSLSYSITGALKKYSPSQKVQDFLIENVLARLNSTIFAESYWSEESLLKIMPKKPLAFRHITNRTPAILRMAVQKDFNNLRIIEPQTAELCLFLLERNPKALPLITIVPNKDVKTAIKMLKDKIEVLKALE